MVRNYKRKTVKGAGTTYSSEDLEKAVCDVKNGNKTTRGAAVFYNIPRSTLKHYVLGTRGKGNVSQDSCKGGGGVKSYLPVSDEEELANGIRIMEKSGFGLTREEVLDIVQCYIVQNKLNTRFKNQRPGEDWFQSFRKRNRLSIKKPQSIEHSRCDQTNPWVIYDFFDKLTQVIKELGLNGKPGQIFNCDETSFCHDPSKTRVVRAINVKSQRKTSASGRENTTALLCVSADGKMLPMLCVFKGKFVMENWVDQLVSASERGWMETTLFFNWFRDVFLTNIGTKRPVLLLYDGHSTHISANLIRLAQQNQVTIMKLPPHTTHVLQPLDVAVFGALKQKWDRDLCKWQRQNPRKKIPKPDFISLLSQSAKGISSLSIINGFRVTGIYDPDPEYKGPNRKVIPESIFSPIDLLKYKKHQTENLTSKSTTSELEPMTDETLHYSFEHPQTLQGDSVQISTSHHDQALTVELEQTKVLEPEQPSSSEPHMNMVVDLPKTHQVDSAQPSTSHHDHELRIELKQTPIVEPEQSSSSEPHVNTEVDFQQPLTYRPTTEHKSPLKRKTFEDLLLELVRNDKTLDMKPKKRRKILNNCEIITTLQYLEMKEKEEEEKKRASIEKEEKRKKREEKAKAKKEKRSVGNEMTEKAKSKTKHVHYDSSSDEDAYSIQESEEDFRLESLYECEDEDTVSLKPGEFCIVKVFGQTENNFRLYVAKVVQKEDDGYMVLFYKRHNQTMKFKETGEESYIRELDIIRKLPQPVTSSSARFNNMIGFAADFTDLTNIH